jgi:4-amino-4-deoxy-L-arabinose transferase-like glycosyltransferase
MKIKLSKKHRVLLALGLIIVIGSCLRLVGLPDWLHFAGDEGRDLLIVEEIIFGENFRLLGPSASTGGFFLGPAYYYLIALPLIIFNHPAAPAFLVALFGIATIWLIYLTTRRLATPAAGLIAALIYATSLVAITYSRWSWNPNPLPFFVTLIIWCVWGINQPSKKSQGRWSGGIKYTLLLGLALGIAVQLHAVALLLFPALLIFWLIFHPRVKSLKAWLIGIGVFLLTQIPWLWYEVTNNFANLRGVFNVLGQEREYIFSERLVYVARSLAEFCNGVFFGDKASLLLVAIFLFAILLLFLWNLTFAKNRLNPAAWLLVILSGLGISFYLVYSGLLFPHYFLILLPVLIIGAATALTGSSWWHYKIARWLIIALILAISYAGIYTEVDLLNKVAKGNAVGSFGVALQDQRAVVAEIKKISPSQIDLQLETKDNFTEAFWYLLRQEDIVVSADAPVQAVIFRPSEQSRSAVDFADRGQILKVETLGNLSLIIIAKW